MHEFRWMAPIRVGFTSAPGVMDRDPAAYESFWDRVALRVRSRPWTLHRATASEETRIGWSKATADSLPRSLQAVTGQVDPARLPNSTDLEVTELSWSLYDHGVLLVQGMLRTPEGTSDALLRDADHWEAAVQEVGSELTRHCAREDFAFLAQQLAHFADVGDFVLLEELSVGQPLWVTRQLAFNPQDATCPTFARAWVSEIDAHHRNAVEDLIDGDRPIVAQWMNHVYRPDRAEAVALSWGALQKAQFFWSATHWIDDSLRQILAWSMAERTEVSVTGLRRELRATMNRAQELLMLRADVRQHVSRRTHEEMQRFLGVWEYTELLEGPVHEKVEICKERLSSLAEDRAARSAMFTDIILMSIGVTSVLATAIALVQFGRDAGQDPSQSIFDLGGGSITSWLSSQSMDAILILSLLASIVLVAVFIWKRRQSVS